MMKLYNEIGDPINAETLFTLHCYHTCYIVRRDNESQEVYCNCLKWNPWNGTYVRESEGLTRRELETVDRMLAVFGKAPGKYPMKGEHYDVRESAGGRLKIKRSNRCTLFSPWLKAVSIITRLLIFAAFGLFIANLFTRNIGFSWASYLLPGLKGDTLKVLLYAVILVIGFLFVSVKHGDITDCLISLAVPACWFLILGMAKLNTVYLLLLIILGGGVFLKTIFPLLAEAFRPKLPSGEKRMYVRKAMARTEGLSVFFGAVMLFFMIVLNNNPGSLYYGTPVADAGDAEAITERYETALENISPDKWYSLTDEELTDTLQAIADYECVNVLGCDTVQVSLGVGLGENVLGAYRDTDNTIVVDISFAGESYAEDVVETLLHEVRHKWQWEVVGLYSSIKPSLDEKYFDLDIIKKAEEMSYNFHNYSEGADGFDEYYDQAIESDSRQWAEMRIVEAYMPYLNPEGWY